MINYAQNQISYAELTILFSDCSVKFETMLNSYCPPPTSHLLFNKFVSLLDYDYLASFDFSSHFFGYLFLPDCSKLNEQQKAACDNFTMTILSGDYTMAETVDEKAEFIYLIVRNSSGYQMAGFMAQAQFGIYRWSYEELWGNCSSIPLMKSLHSGNQVVLKQLLNLKEYFSIYRQHISNWSMALFSKEMMYDELYKELRAKKKKEKVKKADIDPNVCIRCYKCAKNIVFLPCGHICICKDCAVNELELELCKIIYKKASASNCFVCRKPIKEAREVFL